LTSFDIELDLSLKVIHPHWPHCTSTSILMSGQSITSCHTDVWWLQFANHTYAKKQWGHFTIPPHQDSSVVTTWWGFNRQTIHQHVLSTGRKTALLNRNNATRRWM